MDINAELLLAIQGLIQGFTEIFPVSSAGHLMVLSEVFRLPPVSVERAALLHLGSLAAIGLLYGRQTWDAYTGQLGLRLQVGLIAAVGTTAAIGLAIKYGLFRLHPWTSRDALACLGLNGLLLWLAGEQLSAPTRASIPMNQLQGKHFLALGVIQGIAALPGISRLGMTLLVGLWAGLTWKDSLSLSFFVGLPVIFGAGALGFWNSHAAYSLSPGQLSSLALAFGASLASILAILWHPTLERRLLRYFGFYMVALAILCAVILL